MSQLPIALGLWPAYHQDHSFAPRSAALRESAAVARLPAELQTLAADARQDPIEHQPEITSADKGQLGPLSIRQPLPVLLSLLE